MIALWLLAGAVQIRDGALRIQGEAAGWASQPAASAPPIEVGAAETA